MLSGNAQWIDHAPYHNSTCSIHASLSDLFNPMNIEGV